MMVRSRLRALFDAAVSAVSAEAILPAIWPVAPASGRLAIIAAGKAAGAMMQIAEARFASPFVGLAITRYGHLPPHWQPGRDIEVVEAGHPVPDEASLYAAQRALALAKTLDAGDELLVLLSGGGSALLTAPADGVKLADKQQVTRALLRSGATIQEINVVRKHLSAIKGGRLALAAMPARMTTWVVSDVPGDDPALIASGPTLADPSTLHEARMTLARYDVALPDRVASALRNPVNETPKTLANATLRVLASGHDALAAAARLAVDQGYAILDLGDALQGEASRLGAEHAWLARRIAESGGSTAILSGGETSVTVVNPAGRGGRNLEYLLGLAIALDGHPTIAAIAGDTDGIDGTEDAAGAVVLPDTLVRARSLGLDAALSLRENDAYSFFDRLGDLVRTGPTLTNVNDFRAILT
jgi:glycerate 2-kinase